MPGTVIYKVVVLIGSDTKVINSYLMDEKAKGQRLSDLPKAAEWWNRGPNLLGLPGPVLQC